MKDELLFLRHTPLKDELLVLPPHFFKRRATFSTPHSFKRRATCSTPHSFKRRATCSTCPRLLRRSWRPRASTALVWARFLTRSRCSCSASLWRWPWRAPRSESAGTRRTSLRTPSRYHMIGLDWRAHSLIFIISFFFFSGVSFFFQVGNKL